MIAIINNDKICDHEIVNIYRRVKDMIIAGKKIQELNAWKCACFMKVDHEIIRGLTGVIKEK